MTFSLQRLNVEVQLLNSEFSLKSLPCDHGMWAHTTAQLNTLTVILSRGYGPVNRSKTTCFSTSSKDWNVPNCSLSLTQSYVFFLTFVLNTLALHQINRPLCLVWNRLRLQTTERSHVRTTVGTWFLNKMTEWIFIDWSHSVMWWGQRSQCTAEV